jgi:hypothetical protein
MSDNNTDFLPKNPSFDFVKSDEERMFLISAYSAIGDSELWNWLKTYDPDLSRGFMFTTCPELDRLRDSLNNDPVNYNHSGSSYGMTMRQMQYIAKNGYSKYRTEYIRNINL